MLNTVIIDSNAITRDLLHQVLVNGGYHIAGQTNTASQGLALILKHHPHLVCIDQHIFEDDPHLLAHIQEAQPKTLIFMVSNHLDAATVQTGLAQGMHGFIIKPFNAGAVLATIKNAVVALVKRQQAMVAS